MTTVKLENLPNMSVFFYGEIKDGGFLRIKQIFRTKLEWFLKFKQRKKLQPKSTQLLMGKFKFVFQRWEVVQMCTCAIFYMFGLTFEATVILWNLQFLMNPISKPVWAKI